MRPSQGAAYYSRGARSVATVAPAASSSFSQPAGVISSSTRRNIQGVVVSSGASSFQSYTPAVNSAASATLGASTAASAGRTGLAASRVVSTSALQGASTGVAASATTGVMPSTRNVTTAAASIQRPTLTSYSGSSSYLVRDGSTGGGSPITYSANSSYLPKEGSVGGGSVSFPTSSYGYSANGYSANGYSAKEGSSANGYSASSSYLQGSASPTVVSRIHSGRSTSLSYTDAFPSSASPANAALGPPAPALSPSASPSISDRPPLEFFHEGQTLEYLSASVGSWIQCVVCATRADGAVQIDVKKEYWMELQEQSSKLRLPGSATPGAGQAKSPAAQEEGVQTTGLPAGMKVEYYNESFGRWIAATVEYFNPHMGTYKLDVQESVHPDQLRIPAEPSPKTNGDSQLSPPSCAFQLRMPADEADMPSRASSFAHSDVTMSPRSPSRLHGDSAFRGPAFPEEVDTVPRDDVKPASPDEVDTVPRDDVKVSKVTLQDGASLVVVTDLAGTQLGAFDKSAIEFELHCTTEQLDPWLNGLATQILPGLLMLIAGEVNERGALLKDTEKERDDLRGTEDYDFFGLDADECDEKTIDRAYRRASTKLHPDKGGDEAAFAEMRKRYDQLKALRGEEKPKDQKAGGGSIKWDPKSRVSMITAHADLRGQLVWITKKIEDASGQIAQLRERQQTCRALTN